jgi:histone deacetylase 6
VAKTIFELPANAYVVSAGFDAAEGDQLGGCHVSPGGYAQMTHMLSALAGGRMVIALEVG